MKISQFSPDKMYKFMAIFGLTLVIGTYFVVNWEMSNKSSEQVKLERSKLRYEKYKAFLTSAVNMYKQQVDNRDMGANIDFQEHKKLKGEYNKYSKLLSNNEKNKVSDGDIQKVKSDLKILNVVLQFGTVTGLGFTIIGIISWYFKPQRLQDYLTEIKVKINE